jgi:aldehyde:ferredoxin oxidoreductase
VFTDFYGEGAAMLRHVTGWDVTASELRDTARRIVAAKHEVNVRAGWTPEEDTLPERFLSAPLSNDPVAALTHERLQEMVAEYYRQRGWT